MTADRSVHPDERLRDVPLDELLTRLVQDAGVLVRQEMALARAEMREKARAASRGGAMAGAGAVVGLMSAGALTATAIVALALAMQLWLAALIVAVVLGVTAWALVAAGAQVVRRAMPPVPEDTATKVKEDIARLKGRTRSELR